ncbi:MAG TPA: L-threonylcarbamoyladenylate synthase [Polyangia bacterium]|nr:L-threonylcarbamoyladenylate synthase [Polyangia bacterium]
MQRIAADLERFDPRWADEVARVLSDGGVAAIPTDTVYGLVCDLSSRRGVERLYQAKAMDRRHALAFLLPDLSGVARYAVVTNFAYRVMRRLLPGPYCIELEATREVPRMLLDRRRVVGIRVPESEFVQALLKALGRPVLASGANAPKSDTPLADADAIVEHYGSAVDLIVDAGPIGQVPSTVISLVGDQLEVVREGKGKLEL